MMEDEREEKTVMTGSMAGSTSEESLPLTATGTSSEEIAPVYIPVKKKLMIAVSQSNMGDGYAHASYTSTEAFDWTMDNILGTSYDRYKIFLIHVQAPQPWIRKVFSLVRSYVRDRWFLGIGASVQSRAAGSPDHRKEVLEFMEICEGECRDKNIEYESLLKIGCPKKVICDEIKNVKPDLLVLGSKGLSNFQRLFRANVSDYCAKYAQCPVTIRVKRPPALIKFYKGIQFD